MDAEDPHDIAAQQAAAQAYQPAHETPLVGSKLPCENITNEYAKADPIYVEKTMALPQSYSRYRPVRGDGNCGWRGHAFDELTRENGMLMRAITAIGFSYFEKLAESGDRSKIQDEFARLTAYNQLLETVGDFNYWEDFAEPAMELLTDLASHTTEPDASLALVHERWNDENGTNAIIYYLRLLAATYLKEHRGHYDPFVPGGSGVQGYCDTTIMPVNREIEHLGITALANVLLKPIGVIMEIAYLDRSEGATVNQYRFPEEYNEPGVVHMGPIIYLLYRPDHYDILYRAEDQSTTSGSASGLVYEVNRAEILPVELEVENPAMARVADMSGVDFELLSTMLPNFFNVDGGDAISSPRVTNPLPDSFGTQSSPWATGYDEGISATSPTAMPPSTTTASTNPSTPMTPASSSNAGGAPKASKAVGSCGAGHSGTSDCQIRFSNAQYDYDGISDQFKVQTSTFKNSVYNTAHYRNPNFHPEECHPEGDSPDKRPTLKKKKRQDS